MLHSRRKWLQQGALATLGLVAGHRLQAAPHPALHLPRYADGPIRLSSNENPYGPGPAARQAMADAVVSSNRYPWDVTGRLLEKIGQFYGLSADHVLIGAGSSEILGLVAQYAALQQKGNAIAADPTFRIWFTAAQQFGLNIISVPLNTQKQHDLPAMLSRLNNDTRLFYICNPNNPTGTVLDPAALKDCIAAAGKKAIVLLDEAYTEYSDETSLAGLVANNPNLVIAKTFSKVYGLAGARVGYALGHPTTIEKIGRLQPWANAGASAVSLAGALASLEDQAFVRRSRELNAAARAYTVGHLEQLGMEVIPSHTNFVYFSLQDYQKNFFGQLQAARINGTRIMEENGKWTRISIGNMEEMQTFVRSIS